MAEVTGLDTSAPAIDAPPEPKAALPAPPVIKVRDLSLTFVTADGPVAALSGINLDVGRGEFVSLIGPSGCGKTTLLRVIADLEQPTGGYDPGQRRDARGGAPGARLWLRLPGGSPLSVAEHCPQRRAAARDHGARPGDRDLRVRENLELVNLTGFERKFPWQLSGGMQQRVSIARALAVRPELLLMDEPFGALDEIVRDHLNEQLLRLWAKTDKTVVFVTHSIPEAVFLSTRSW